tara:strand:+ start:57 stop:302 length:246 start_codon:yes stop_codon:yes gene_type:complete
MKLTPVKVENNFAYMIAEVKVFENKVTTVHLRCTSNAAVITSEHTLNASRMIVVELCQYTILKFAMEMIKADKVLKTPKQF